MLEVRPSTAADDAAVLALMQASLGWMPDDLHRTFFAWKHRDNPFGASPGWVAVDGGEVIGFRTFLRWEFDTPQGEVRAVRAVDTATHPDHRGRGIFTKLTLGALDSLSADGNSFVFNTPNEQSRPGYLKMGWQVVGRLPVRVRLGSPGSLARLARSRVAADLWSLPCSAGLPADAALQDMIGLQALVDSQPPPNGVRTARSGAFLAWRYGFAPLNYRALLRRDRIDAGVALFRLRRRGRVVEAAICDVLAPDGDARAVAELLRAVAKTAGADHAIVLGDQVRGSRFVELPRSGPILTWRALTAHDPPTRWLLSLGDVELF